jgi:ubiquinone/menaquinone biosynthesis C-methylase UbiE
MGLHHYFSKDADKRARFIFNFIAPIYGRLNPSVEKNFYHSIDVLDKKIQLKGKAVLDLGTGTGAWAANFKNRKAASVTGVDFSRKMLLQAQKSYPDLKFEQGNAENLKQFGDNSFDIVTASFVLHGVKEPKRATILKEMHRVSRKYIVIHDFIGETPFSIRVLEFLERSDYKFFKQNFCNELKAHFPKSEKIPTRFGTGIYLAEK